jgi:hypothetical protein
MKRRFESQVNDFDMLTDEWRRGVVFELGKVRIRCGCLR